jgi:hypothetical protein
VADDNGTHDQAGAERSWLRNWRSLAWWAQVATILAVVVAVIAYVFPRAAGDDSDRGTSVPNGPVPPSAGLNQSGRVTASQGPTEPASAERHYLTDLRPVAGGINLTPAPDDVTYAHDLLIPCGSGQSDDQQREVAYAVRGNYREFRAAVQYGATTEPAVRAQLEVFADSRLVLGTVATSGEAERPLTARLGRPDMLRLRLTCAIDEGTLVLFDAELVK